MEVSLRDAHLLPSLWGPAVPHGGWILAEGTKAQVPQAGPGISKGLAEERSEIEEHGDEKPCFFCSSAPKVPLLFLQLRSHLFLILQDKLATRHEERGALSPLPTRNQCITCSSNFPSSAFHWSIIKKPTLGPHLVPSRCAA